MRLRSRRQDLIDRLRRVPLWAWFFIGVAALGLAIVPGILLARYTTSSSSYCLTCHGTGDTIDRSQPSLVHPSVNKVGCVDCHAKTHQVVYEGYVRGFMAEPERISPNCLRCHQNMAKTNDQKGFKYNFHNIRITHQAHLERGASCVDCHANVAHDLKVPATNRPPMEVCYACHAVKSPCLNCHQGKIPEAPVPPPAPSGLNLAGDGRVYYLRVCSACHGPTGDRVSQVNLRSREFLERRGEEALLKSIYNGKGAMHGFSLAKGGFLTQDQIKAILAYLMEEALSGAPPQPETLYNRYCLVCHGADGNKVAGVSLTSAQFWQDRPTEMAFFSVQRGQGGMPPFGKGEGGQLTRQEIETLLNYLKAKSGVLGQELGSVLDGRALYLQYCALCHGPKGGQLPMADLSSPAFLRQKGATALEQATLEGKGGMPSFGKAKGGPLDTPEVKAIIQYLIKEAGE